MAKGGGDVQVNATAFKAENASDGLKAMVEGFAKASGHTPRMHEVGITKFRELADAGQVGLPPPVFLPEAVDGSIPSRDADRRIPVRVYKPDNGQPSRGVMLYSHAGGWIMSSHKNFDFVIKRYANDNQLTVVSVGYRLSPEHPYPAPVDDCHDAAEYLIEHGEAEYGAPLVVMGGASAGAHLVVLTAFKLIRERPSYQLGGLILMYGSYDVTGQLPSFRAVPAAAREGLLDCSRAFLPGRTDEEMRDPLVSPVYDDIWGLARASPGGTLPPALFICGSEDFFLDDTVLLGTKWLATGSPTEIKIVPGAPHGFDFAPGLKESDEAFAQVAAFLKTNVERLAGGN